MIGLRCQTLQIPWLLMPQDVLPVHTIDVVLTGIVQLFLFQLVLLLVNKHAGFALGSPAMWRMGFLAADTTCLGC